MILKFITSLLIVGLLAGCTSKPPNCSDPKSIGLLQDTVIDRILETRSFIRDEESILNSKGPSVSALKKLINILHPRPVDYNKDIQKFSCRATISISPKDSEEFLEVVEAIQYYGIHPDTPRLLADQLISEDQRILHDFMLDSYSHKDNQYLVEVTYTTQLVNKRQIVMENDLSKLNIVSLQVALATALDAQTEKEKFNIKSYSSEINKAARDFLDIHRDSGVTAVIGALEKCYSARDRSVGNSIYCMTFDSIASSYIPFIEKQNGWPITKEFEKTEYVSRVRKEIERIGFGTEAESIIEHINTEAGTALNSVLDGIEEGMDERK